MICVLSSPPRSARWRAERPDVVIVIMDVSMPIMNGLEATMKIRELEAKAGVAHTPIIAATANAMAEDRERCLKAGMDDYLAKPIKTEALKQVLREWSPQWRGMRLAAGE